MVVVPAEKPLPALLNANYSTNYLYVAMLVEHVLLGLLDLLVYLDSLAPGNFLFKAFPYIARIVSITSKLFLYFHDFECKFTISKNKFQ